VSNHWSDTPEAKVEEAIPDGAMAEYEWLLNELGETLVRLEKRIDPVLTQYAEVGDREKLVQLPSPPIRGLNDRLRQMNTGLNGLIHRIDL
jgi:hypothetical protein